MPKIIRNLVASIRKTINRINSSRRQLEVPISVSFVPQYSTGRLTVKHKVLSLKGETKDLSATGIAFLVDSIRLHEHYLVGENRVLNAELDLPNGRVTMQIIGQRYEQIDEHLSVNKYLIGAAISSMAPLERGIYEEFLRLGNKAKKDPTKVLEFGVTKS